MTSSVLNAVKVAGDAIASGEGTVSFQQAIGAVVSADEIVSSIYNPSNFGTEIQQQKLSPQELKSFSAWYYNNFVIPTQDSLLRDFFDTKFPNALLMLLHAKHSFNQGVFGTFGKGSIHAQQIRPVTVYASGGTSIENWLLSSVAAGWNSSIFNIDLTHTSITGSLNLANNVEMLVFGFGDFNSSSKLYEVRPAENGTNPIGVRSHSLMRSPITEKIVLFDQVIGIPKDSKFTFDGNYAAAGASEPFLTGVQFVTSNYYNQE
jgi:hypothetical protein